MYYREQWLRRLRGNTEELLFERVFKRRHRVLLQWGTGRKCVNLSLQCTRIPFPHSTESLWQRRAMVGHETSKWKESIQCYMQRYLVMYFTCFSILKLKCFEYGFHCISKKRTRTVWLDGEKHQNHMYCMEWRVFTSMLSIHFSVLLSEVLCPAHLQLDSGQIWPRGQWFKVGEQQTFSCDNGFALLGSAQRNCTRWGVWTGTTPVCDDQSKFFQFVLFFNEIHTIPSVR